MSSTRGDTAEPQGLGMYFGSQPRSPCGLWAGRNRSRNWKRDFQLQNSSDFARGKRNEPVWCDGIKYLHLQNAESY